MTAIINEIRLPFEKKLDAILREIASCMRVDKASIMLRTGRSSLRVVASTNPDIVGMLQRLSDNTPSTWVIRNKKPLSTDLATMYEVIPRRFSHYRGEAFYIVPIINRKKAIGVISVTDRIGDDRFTPEDRQTLLTFAGHIITAIDNNRLATSLSKSHAVLKRQNKELARLEHLRTELFNMLIHDLKGPLSEIVAHLDILSYMLHSEPLTYIETAKSACDTMQRMVSNLLDIARMEEGELQLIYEPLSPRELIKEAIARLLVSGKAKELSLIEQYPEYDIPSIAGDRDLLLRVLQNLLSNAIQYSPHGATITIGCQSSHDKHIEFFVQDAGPGVPEAYQNAIFEKYTRFHPKSDGRVYSVGLGLAFCKMVVSAHGGSIGVQSNGVNGSKFYFILPCDRSQHQSVKFHRR
ncbi:MAG: ATP-binding protein [Desulfobacterota bacterium]|nr:ATP-binding protein [Thermodesulfobacteriota bacterium]